MGHSQGRCWALGPMAGHGGQPVWPPCYPASSRAYRAHGDWARGGFQKASDRISVAEPLKI